MNHSDFRQILINKFLIISIFITLLFTVAGTNSPASSEADDDSNINYTEVSNFYIK